MLCSHSLECQAAERFFKVQSELSRCVLTFHSHATQANRHSIIQTMSDNEHVSQAVDNCGHDLVEHVCASCLFVRTICL